MKKSDTNTVAAYICQKAALAGADMSVLKLHKLLYYVQAWSLAFFGEEAVDTEFQAWVHGPVSRPLFDRFKAEKSLYSGISPDEFSEVKPDALEEDVRVHIDNVLSSYMKFTGGQLEEMSHREEPWISARGNRSPLERCETVIDRKVMQTYYAKRLQREA